MTDVSEEEDEDLPEEEEDTPLKKEARGRGARGRRGGAGRSRRGRGYLPPAIAEGLARHAAVQQKVYKMKYKQMKGVATSLVLVGEAIYNNV